MVRGIGSLATLLVLSSCASTSSGGSSAGLEGNKDVAVGQGGNQAKPEAGAGDSTSLDSTTAPEGSSSGGSSGGSPSESGGSPSESGGTGASDAGDSSDSSASPDVNSQDATDDANADCDCTAEHPCSMRCDGVTVKNGFGQDVSSGPLCDVVLDRQKPCPDGTGSQCGGQVIVVRAISINFRSDTYYTVRWYDPSTYEQKGWEFFFMIGGRVCGGVVGNSLTCGDPGAGCYTGPDATTCDCPLPDCDGPCPNYYPCEDGVDCKSGSCVGGVCHQ
jgi:hypothetical protein